MIKLWNTYNKVKNVFKKPKLRWYFGKWRNDPCLPIWRSGNVIRFAKYNECTREYNVARYIGSKWNDLGKKNHMSFQEAVYQAQQDEKRKEKLKNKRKRK